MNAIAALNPTLVSTPDKTMLNHFTVAIVQGKDRWKRMGRVGKSFYGSISCKTAIIKK